MNDSNFDSSTSTKPAPVSDLLEGRISPDEFSLNIQQYSKARTTNIFRDFFPKFTSNLKIDITDFFVKYFFNDSELDRNEFWEFSEIDNFWSELKAFHDLIYAREMILEDVLDYFTKMLGLHFSDLEKQIIKELSNNPSSLFKDLAEKLGVSEKEISILLKNLKKKRVYLGSFIDYSRLNLHEFFAINKLINKDNQSVLIDYFLLFPEKSSLIDTTTFIHGIKQEKEKDSEYYYVKDKRLIFNSEILIQGISIENWENNTPKSQRVLNWKTYSRIGKGIQSLKNFRYRITKNRQLISSMKTSYPNQDSSAVTHLLRNCEMDFKKPSIDNILKTHDISARTLFRTKSRLIEERIIQPGLFVENLEMVQLFLISKHEPYKLYTKIPFIITYKVKKSFWKKKWFSYLSIFHTDFIHLCRHLKNRTEIFRVIKRYSPSTLIIPIKSRFHSSDKTLTPFPKDPGDDMTGAAAGMARRYKNTKEE
jgi:DNA-binding Lrp family transcriptional regulator